MTNTGSAPHDHNDLPDWLADWVVPMPGGLQRLAHPLLDTPLMPWNTVATLTTAIEHKQALIADAIASGHWSKFLLLHERQYRLDAVLEHASEMNDEAYWKALGVVWIDTELPSARTDEWIAAFASSRPRRSSLMDDDERAALARLPDPVTAYRGLSEGGVVEGMSWTLDEGVAIRFAYRFAAEDHDDALVATTMLPSRAVLAYLRGRQEHELVVLPDQVSDVSIRQLPPRTVDD